jgi:hypothetical protein
MADEILRALRQRQKGMTRTEIRDLFGRNYTAYRLAKALGLLERYELAFHRPESDTGGRPAERWFAVRH